MQIREQEDELFERWSQKYKGLFVSDGVPCPEQFESEKIKITFVLKEANSPGESWDMRGWVNKCGARPQTWNNITRWTQAILDGGDYPQAVSKEIRICFLNRISFLNLKKTGGTRASKPAEIRKYAKNDAELIFDQISIYQPDIIVCCGINLVADCLADYVFNHEITWEYNEKCFYTKIPGKAKKTAVLNYYHPLNLGTSLTGKEMFDEMLKITPIILNGR